MSWALPDDVLASLAARLDVIRPDLAVEAGSGRSTAVLARHARRVVSLEHSTRFARETLAGIEGAGNVDLRRVDLVPTATPAGQFRWYDTAMPDKIGFALIDGPPGYAVGRQAAGFEILPRMVPGGEVWLDDAERDHEQECLQLWAEHLPIRIEQHPTHPRIAIIRVHSD